MRNPSLWDTNTQVRHQGAWWRPVCGWWAAPRWLPFTQPSLHLGHLFLQALTSTGRDESGSCDYIPLPASRVEQQPDSAMLPHFPSSPLPSNHRPRRREQQIHYNQRMYTQRPFKADAPSHHALWPPDILWCCSLWTRRPKHLDLCRLTSGCGAPVFHFWKSWEINEKIRAVVSPSRDWWPAAAHLVLVVVVPLLEEGALLGMHLGADRGSAALSLLRDVDLGREGSAEALHINPGTRISWQRRKTLKEGRVDGGRDTWVEAVVRVRVGYLVNGVGVDGIDGAGGGRGRWASLNGPRGSEAGERRRRGAYAGALHLLGGEVRKSGAETSGQHVAGAAAAIAVHVVGDGGVHLELVRFHGSGRWRRSINFSLFHRGAAGVGGAVLQLPLRQVTESSAGRGRLCRAELGVLTERLRMRLLAGPKVTDRRRRAKISTETRENRLLFEAGIIRGEWVQSDAGLVLVSPGFAVAALFLGWRG